MGEKTKDKKKSEKKAQKTSWFQGMKAEFKKVIWPDKKTLAKQTAAVVSVSVFLGALISVIDVIVKYGIDLLVKQERICELLAIMKGDFMSEAKWYVVHTYSGYENKVKANIDKTIENRHLEDQILEVRVPMQEVIELKNGAEKAVQKKMFPGYVMIHMIMNDDTWYVVRNTRGVTGFVGPGSKPVPLTEEEMLPLGIQSENIVVDFEEGDTITVVAGAWEGTVGAVQTVNPAKQSLTINVELFGRETPVELSFTEVKKM